MSSKENNAENQNTVVMKERNMKKIVVRRSKIYVGVAPDVNGDECSLSFPFFPQDELSKEFAMKGAIKYRDNRILLSKTSNTGYYGITVVKMRDDIYVKVEFKHDPDNPNLAIKDITVHPHIKEYLLNSEMPYRKALKSALEYMCGIYGYAVPLIINYDYGTASAFALGYKGHPLDLKEKDAIAQPRTGKAITCPVTGDEGTIRRIIDDLIITATFKVGTSVRDIRNQKLFASRMEEHTKVIERLEEELKNEELSNAEKQDITLDIEYLTRYRESMFKLMNDNKVLLTDKSNLEKVVVANRKIPGIVVSKKNLVPFAYRLQEYKATN